MINLTITKNSDDVMVILGESDADYYKGKFPQESLALEDEGFNEQASDLFRRDLRQFSSLAYAAQQIVNEWDGEIQYDNEKELWIHCHNFYDHTAWMQRKEMTSETLLKISANIKKGKYLTIRKIMQ
jgi:hypothetical protein